MTFDYTAVVELYPARSCKRSTGRVTYKRFEGQHTLCARKSGADLSQSVLIADDRQVPHRGGEKCS